MKNWILTYVAAIGLVGGPLYWHFNRPPTLLVVGFCIGACALAERLGPLGNPHRMLPADEKPTSGNARVDEGLQ